MVCEPSDMLAERIADGDIDLAIVTEAKARERRGTRRRADAHAATGGGASDVTIRTEALLWVTSSRHAVHTEEPVPLALGRPACNWRVAAIEALERGGRQSRILFVSWNSTAVGAAVLAGLAVSVLPESALRSGMRGWGPQDGFAALPACRIGLMRQRRASRTRSPTSWPGRSGNRWTIWRSTRRAGGGRVSERRARRRICAPYWSAARKRVLRLVNRLPAELP